MARTLHFRGVLGTESGEHGAGTTVVPVVRIGADMKSLDVGRPGADDAAFVVGDGPNDLGFAAFVHRAHYPAPSRVFHAYTSPNDGTLSVVAASETTAGQGNSFDVQSGYVAFDRGMPVPTPAGGAAAAADLLGPTEVLPPGALLELPPDALPDESTLDVRLEDCNGDRLLEHVAVPRGPGIRVVLRARPTRLRGPRAHVGPSD